MESARRAAELTEECVRRIAGWHSRRVPEAQRSVDGMGPAHALWMLGEIQSGAIDGNKAQRWLGYAQGVLVMCGMCHLAEMKDANMAASDEES